MCSWPLSLDEQERAEMNRREGKEGEEEAQMLRVSLFSIVSCVSVSVCVCVCCFINNALGGRKEKKLFQAERKK